MPYLLSVDVRPRKWYFPRKFENGVVLTTKNTEHPGQSLGKTHEKSKYRQGGFLQWKIKQEPLSDRKCIRL